MEIRLMNEICVNILSNIVVVMVIYVNPLVIKLLIPLIWWASAHSYCSVIYCPQWYKLLWSFRLWFFVISMSASNNTHLNICLLLCFASILFVAILLLTRGLVVYVYHFCGTWYNFLEWFVVLVSLTRILKLHRFIR